MEKNSECIEGALEPWVDSCTEGHIVWALFEDGKAGYDGLHLLQTGDILTIFKDAKREVVAWEGAVDLDFDCNRLPHPENPQFKPQTLLRADGSRIWLSGFQKNVDPEIWVEMFAQELPARLVRAKKEAGPQP